MLKDTRFSAALNAALETEHLCVAFNFAMSGDGAVPEWVQLIPAGVDIAGIDGRSWVNDAPQGIVDHFNALQSRGRDLVFDFEHSTELKAPQGDNAPAAAWGKALEIRVGGSIWARPDWNEIGRNAISRKEYRYLSPVLIFEKATQRIVGIKSVGLTNNPNLFVTALNQAQSNNNPQTKQEDKTMLEFLKAQCRSLGISDSGSEEELKVAINQALTRLQQDRDTALNQAQNPGLDKFVPRGDYDAALNRAQSAEDSLASINKATRDGEIETAINQALKDGKITPASKDYHIAQCQAEGGLDRFNEFVKAQPVVTGKSGLDDKDPGDKTGTALNAVEQKMADQFGNSAEELAKYG